VYPASAAALAIGSGKPSSVNDIVGLVMGGEGARSILGTDHERSRTNWPRMDPE
jgi:hypothetical protein